MKYKEFTSITPVKFDTPKKMLVWDDDSDDAEVADVFAYYPGRALPVVGHADMWKHCAEIPKEQYSERKSRRATYLELAIWLAQGEGLFQAKNGQLMRVFSNIDREIAKEPLPQSVLVRRWDDKEWHEPTADYMGLEE